MGVKNTFRVTMKRKDKKSKYLMKVLSINTMTYRNDKDETVHKVNVYRKVEKNVNNG